MRPPSAYARAVLLAMFVASSPAAIPTASAQAPAYEIKLVRTPKVGQKYTLTAEGAVLRQATITVGGKSAGTNEDGFGVRLEGTVEVLAVNADGEEAKAACTVAKCVRLTADGEDEILPPGRVVTATGGKEDTTFAVDQGDLTDEAKEALDLVLRMGEDDGYNDDRIYGTKDRQPVGGSWSIDQQAASDEAKADGVEFAPKEITAALKLEGVERVDGVECLRIGGETEIKRFLAKPPKDMTFDRGSLKARYAGLYPTDGTTGTLGESMSVTHHSRFRGKAVGGREAALVDSKVQRATEMKRKFIPGK